MKKTAVALSIVSLLMSMPTYAITNPDDKLPDQQKGTAVLEANKEFMMGGRHCYGHLFIDQIYGTSPAIPCQSLFDINATARLGIRYIELNAIKTKDGIPIPIHGSRGKFGREVEDLDGGFTYEDTYINSVTYDWVKKNLRYNSKYEKHRTTIPTLEEAFIECRRNGISALVTYMKETKELALKYFGDNVIFYVFDNMGKDVREGGFGGYVMNYSSSNTIQDVLRQCDTYGAPYLHCLDSPSFEKFMSEGTMDELIQAVHEKNCMIGIAGSYTPTRETMKFFNLGGDFSATASFVNDFENGNLCNLKGDIDYSDFKVTRGKVREGVLNLKDGGTVSTKLPEVYLGKGSLKIRFKGTLRIDYFGHERHEGVEITSDGSMTEWISTYFLEQQPGFKLTAVGDVVITMIDYKASEC